MYICTYIFCTNSMKFDKFAVSSYSVVVLLLKNVTFRHLKMHFISRVATKSNSACNMMNVVRASTFSFPHNILRMKCLI